MTRDNLFIFLGRCLSLGRNPENDQEVKHIISTGQVDWDQFVTLASNHLVIPALYSRFNSEGLLPYLPNELSSHLKMIYDLNCTRNRAIMEQTDRINRLFATAGISPIYLKGTGNMLDNLYENLGDRMIGDIDILVSEDEFLTAANLLKSKGYEHIHKFHEDQRTATKHFPRLVHPTEPADVEIHRVPVNVELSAHFNYGIIEKKKKQVSAMSPAFVLSDRHNVILNFMHGFMGSDIRLSKSVSYRNMFDLFLLSSRVDVFKVFEQMPEYAPEGRIYADFVNRNMNIVPSRLPWFRSIRFFQKHDLFLKSKFIYRLSWLSGYLVYRIWNGYFRNVAGVFFNNQIRKSVLRRLSTPSWYISHIKSYTNSFKQNL